MEPATISKPIKFLKPSIPKVDLLISSLFEKWEMIFLFIVACLW